MKYKTLSKYTLLAANITFLVSFCLGMYPAVTAVASALLLLGVAFWMCQGKCKLGYVYGAGLLGVAWGQYVFALAPLFPMVAASVGLVAIILQTIEHTFKNVPLIKCDNDKTCC